MTNTFNHVDNGSNSISTNTNTNNNPISQLKFNASKLNQQILLSIMPNTATTDSTTLSTTSSLLLPFEFMKMISQFEQYCDELITIQNNLFFKEQQFQLKKQQLESKAQHQQQQLQSQLKEQQLELKEQQFEIKQQQAEFQLKQEQHRQQQQHEQFYNIDEFVSLPLSTISSSSSSSQLPATKMSTTNTALIELPLQQHQQSITTTIQDQNNTMTSIISNELLQHVIQDYQSMKYLVEQSTTTQQLFQQHYAILNEKMKDIDDIKQLQSKVNKIHQIESQLQQSLQDQLNQFEQKLISIESVLKNNNSQIQLQRLTTIVQQRIQVPIILEQNRKSMEDQSDPFIIFQIENCPDFQISCDKWYCDDSINYVFYVALIRDVYPTKLKPLEETIKASKLYISSQSVLNGEWIQIQGDGAIVDMEKEDEKGKVLHIGDFLKPDDNIYKYDDYKCIKCEYPHYDRDDKTTNRYLIKFKWE